MARKAKRPEPLGSILPGVLSRLGLTEPLKEYRAVTCWSQIVGTRISRHAQAEAISNGELTVRVDSHVWIQELTFLKPELIEKLNQELGSTTVRDIRFLLARRRSC